MQLNCRSIFICHHHHALTPLLGYRPSTSVLQSPLSCAFLSSCFHVRPVCPVSAWKSRRQLFSDGLFSFFPGGSMSCGTCCWLLQRVSNPAPSSFTNFIFCWHLLCSLPQVSVSDLFWPVDIEDASQTCVDKCLDPGNGCLCHPLCFRTVKQHRLHV